MKSFVTIIKSDYLQRTRSYAFLITLCASLAIAYTFVPEPNANYSTISISNYVGYYNSAWFGYVTAIMTSVFLSLIGFYLVNSGIKTDIDTKVGQIVAATPISNFKYLFSKVLSNFLVLLTIVVAIFLMSIALFVLYNDGFPFELVQFIRPYLLIPIPALFVISVLAVVFEVFFGKYSVIQNVGFFFLFSFMLTITFTSNNENQFALDVLGNKIVIHQLEESVKEFSNTEETSLNIGYTIGNKDKIQKFQFNGVDFSIIFIISRFVWMLFGIGIIAIISPFFHRFNIKERLSIKKSSSIIETQKAVKDIVLSNLPNVQTNYSQFPLLKTELVMLYRKGKKWLWLLNIIGMILLAILPLKIAHQMVLPILWFLQVHRLSDITTKEILNNVNYFSFTSYKPITRLLSSQLLAAAVLIIALSLPMLIRYAVLLDLTTITSILLGGIFLVFLAALSGILSKGNKLFEVLFFIITYTNVNGIPFTDYFGGFEHNNLYLLQLLILVVVLGSISFIKRKYELYK